MESALQITFRHMDASEAVEAEIRSRAARLDRIYPRVTAGRVVVEAPHQHHHQGKLFHISIELALPQGELVINRQPAAQHAHEDVYVAIRDAFDAAERQVAEFAHRQRAEVKTHSRGSAA